MSDFNASGAVHVDAQGNKWILNAKGAYEKVNIWKHAVNTVSDVNVALTGLQTTDGIIGIVGDRILLINQTDPIENGVFIQAVGAWVRPDASNQIHELDSAVVMALRGAVYMDQQFVQTADSVTPGTDPQTWVSLSGGAAPGGGIGERFYTVGPDLGEPVNVDMSAGQVYQMEGAASGASGTMRLELNGNIVKTIPDEVNGRAWAIVFAIGTTAYSADATDNTGVVGLQSGGVTVEDTGINPAVVNLSIGGNFGEVRLMTFL